MYLYVWNLCQCVDIFVCIEYRKRRESLGKIANQFRINPNTREYEVPIMEYTELENQTWFVIILIRFLDHNLVIIKES